MKNQVSGILLLSVMLCLPLFSVAATEEESAEEEFRQLKADFEDEISYPPYSDYTFVDRYWDSDSGRKIIGMGKRALPFIMEAIESGESEFTVAAERITGIKMKGPTMEDLREEWLGWWEDNQDNPQWNAFIDSYSPQEESPSHSGGY